MPYVMMHYGKNYTGNARFYGFCVDLLERVSKEVGFDYILDLVPDRKYGAQDAETGEWNGMVLQLMKHVCARRRAETCHVWTCVAITRPPVSACVALCTLYFTTALKCASLRQTLFLWTSLKWK